VSVVVADRWYRRRVAFLLGVTAAAVLVVTMVPPLRQDPAYHAFADRRALFGIPFALNVLSNAGFLLVGAWSFVQVARADVPRWERAAGMLFALGLVLTGFGSAWYHLAPDNATLVWDRLPLSALFPIVFAAAIGDRVSPAAGRALFLPLAVFGVVSVVWWDLTDDLRPYALAQFLPLALIPLMLAFFPGRRPARPLIAGVALYAVGKLFEVADGAVLAAGGLVSGHTVKHLLAAVAAAFITRWLAPARDQA
jgi:predicted membrane channel-forming protein YqfA (hemolysin III family)